MMNESINHGVACDVRNCKYNSEGVNCTLNKIQVGCGNKQCPCGESFFKNHYIKNLKFR